MRTASTLQSVFCQFDAISGAEVPYRSAREPFVARRQTVHSLKSGHSPFKKLASLRWSFPDWSCRGEEELGRIVRREIYQFWGKTQREEDGAAAEGADWKPVVHHLLDVAAAAEAIQRVAPARLAREAAALGVTPELLAALSAYLIALHDLGKFARNFQAQSAPHWPANVLGAYAELSPLPRHWELTFVLLAQAAPELMSAAFPTLMQFERDHIAAATAGHHGRPPSPRGTLGLRQRAAILSDAGVAAAKETGEALWELFGCPCLTETQPSDWPARFAWRLAGLTTFADWVGSDSAFFRFLDPALEIDAYWPEARRTAAKALVAKGLDAARPAAFAGLRGLFPMIAEPRPLQVEAEHCALPDGPALILIEDATGAGKTEAAITLAHRLIASGRAEGVYFALPTMATTNAMFDRLKSDEAEVAPYRRLFEPTARPSLALAHGARALSESFAEITLAAPSNAAADDSVAAECAAWIADDRRKAFFAAIGAGTIDQALIAVLPKKHLALRQYGLAGKVLIIDEAHSYDAYVGRELQRLLQFHAAAGGSAIVLSATLAAQTRRQLIRAFGEGLGVPIASPESAAYPLLTLAGATGAETVEPAPAAHTMRSVAAERIGSADEAIETALAAARAGAAVAWVRNSVDDAINAFDRLLAAGADATLFHARFAMGDRLAIERDVVAAFGKPREGRSNRRAGRIVVATQVIEQSLDCDFDLMITDLAPVDGLIQRAGRLWRHERGARPVDGPRLLVLAPDWRAVDSPRWLEATQPKGAFVYHPGVLWRSAAALFEAGAIRAPDGLRDLVEAAYGDGELPEALKRPSDAADGVGLAEASQAKQNLIDWAEGYFGVQGVGEDQEIGTRLGRETWTLRLARLESGAPRPWVAPESSDPAALRRAWALSEVSIARRKGEAFDAPEPPADWSRYEQDRLLAAVANEAVDLETTGGARPFRYSARYGLTRIETPDDA